jgi:hypothetical protein
MLYSDVGDETFLCIGKLIDNQQNYRFFACFNNVKHDVNIINLHITYQ